MNYKIVFIVAIIVLIFLLGTFRIEKNTAALEGNNTIILMDPDGNILLKPLLDIKNSIDSKQEVGDYATKAEAVTKTELGDYATKVEKDYGTKADIARYIENKDSIMTAVEKSVNFVRDNYVDKPAFKRFQDEQLPGLYATKASLNDLETKVEKDYAKYSTLGDYATTVQLRAYAGNVTQDYLTKSEEVTNSKLRDYATKAYVDTSLKPDGDYATKADIARYMENKDSIMKAVGETTDQIKKNYVDKPSFDKFKTEQLPGLYATKASLNDLATKVEKDYAKYSTLGDYATTVQLRAYAGNVTQDYLTKSEEVTNSKLRDYATKAYVDTSLKPDGDYATKADVARYMENKDSIISTVGKSVDFIKDNYVDNLKFNKFKDEQLPVYVRGYLTSNPQLDTNYVRYSDSVDLAGTNDGINMRFNLKKVIKPEYTNQ